MMPKQTFTAEELRYLKLLARQYPTVQAASTEIINLQAILNLPKGTEHFISDIHGEYEAFLHILNSCSGVIKEKVDDLFATTVLQGGAGPAGHPHLLPPRRSWSSSPGGSRGPGRVVPHHPPPADRGVPPGVQSKYTRSKVRKALPKDYAYIIDELLHTHWEETDKRDYYENIISTIIDHWPGPQLHQPPLCQVIKRLAVDHLHIVGDMFDRGPRADIILDSLMDYHSVDIQWGNHDILWMGAASGSRTLVATVLSNSIHYNNLEVIETGYGISLRPLSIFANEVYQNCDTHRFAVKLTGEDAEHVQPRRTSCCPPGCTRPSPVILFKLEGQKILRHPEYRHGGPAAAGQDRLCRPVHHHRRSHLPTGGLRLPHGGPGGPLYPDGGGGAASSTSSPPPSSRSEKLQKHVRFLYSKGCHVQGATTAICSSTAASP